MTRYSALAAMALTATLAAPAFSHVSLLQPSVVAGQPWSGILRVPHGCGKAATDRLQVTLPEGFVLSEARPQDGWQLETSDNQIIWSGGSLADGVTGIFRFEGEFAAGTPGDKAFFPTQQFCGDLYEDWADVSGQKGAAMPAPSAEFVEGGVVFQGDLSLSGAWARETLPAAPVGGAYLRVVNAGAADRLISVRSDHAKEVQLHLSEEENGVMKMRHLPEPLELPGAARTDLKPGGLHLMLMGLEAPLVAGGVVDVTLTFEKAGEITLPFEIRLVSGKAAPNHQAGHEVKAVDGDKSAAGAHSHH